MQVKLWLLPLTTSSIGDEQFYEVPGVGLQTLWTSHDFWLMGR